MSIERDEGLIRFNCDEIMCRKNYESDADFAGAWKEAKVQGWTNTEHRGTWKHYCPECGRDL